MSDSDQSNNDYESGSGSLDKSSSAHEDGGDVESGGEGSDAPRAVPSSVDYRTCETDHVFRVAELQPLAFMCALLGLMKSGNLPYRIYRYLVFLAVLWLPIHLFWATRYVNSPLHVDVTTGMAIVSLSSVFMYFSLAWFLESDHLQTLVSLSYRIEMCASDDSSWFGEAAKFASKDAVSSIDSTMLTVMEKMYKSILTVYSLIALVLGSGLTAFWIYVFWTAYYKVAGVPFVLAHAILCGFNIAVFSLSFTLLLSITTIHRLQTRVFLEHVVAGKINLRYATHFHQKMREALRSTCSHASIWMFSMIVFLTNSTFFQAFGLFSRLSTGDLNVDVYHGAYYLGFTALILLIFIVSAASVTNRFVVMEAAATDIFEVAYSERQEVSHFLNFASLSPPAFTVAGVPITSLVSNFFVIVFFGSAALFVREMLLIYSVS